MTTFIAVYRGQTIADAQIVTVCADPEVVQIVAAHLLGNESTSNGDPVQEAVSQGRREALRRIIKPAKSRRTN